MKRIFFLFFIGFCIGACQNGPEETGTDKQRAPGEAGETQTTADTADTADDERTSVRLKLYTVGEQLNTMKYEPGRLEVPAGAEVKLSLLNKATSEAMVHNVVFITAGRQNEVAEAALAAGSEKNYIPDSQYIIASSDLAEPGDSVRVSFTAPERKGTYEYICTYPGHSDKKGLLMVK